jgi:hypothetical protein
VERRRAPPPGDGRILQTARGRAGAGARRALRDDGLVIDLTGMRSVTPQAPTQENLMAQATG